MIVKRCLRITLIKNNKKHSVPFLLLVYFLLNMRPCGLENNFGEHNCWVNAIVQLLFHLDEFRQAIESIKNHLKCKKYSCQLCQLKELLTEYKRSNELNR